MEETRKRAPRRTRYNTRNTKSRPEKLLVLMIRLLANKESKPFMTQRVQLETSHTQHIFRRVFEKLSNALYRCDEVLMTVSPTAAGRIQTFMDKRYQKLYDDLQKEEGRLESLQESEGISGEVNYTQQKEEDAVIYSPRAMRFVILMRTLDRVIKKIDLMHISGIIETTQAALAKWTWQRRVIGFANELITASNNAVRETRQNLIDKTQAERERLRGAQDAKDAAEAATAGAQANAKHEDLPPEEEINSALQHEIPDVEEIQEHDDNEGDIADIKVPRPRRPRLAAAAG